MKTWFVAVLFAVALFAGGSANASLLSPDDQKTFHQAFDAIHREDYDQALAAAAKGQDKLLQKAVLWAVYVAPNSGASFADITAFIHANPTWPQIATLSRRAEESIAPTTPDKDVIAWFNGSAPQTVDGAMAYGKALIGAGETEKAALVLRRAWITGNFSAVQEMQFLAGFRDLLRPEDQWKRLDRLLWDHQEQPAQAQMVRVDDAHKDLAAARIALATDDANAEALAQRVPDALKDDPGLIYELLHYRRVHEMDEQAIALLSHPSHDKIRPHPWWVERALLARRALTQGHASLAYQIASGHHLTEGASFADAEWLAGWIALRFLDDRAGAMGHFVRMFEHVQMAQSQSRAAYWAGRASEGQGDGDVSRRWYAEAADHVTTFYGQLAAARLHLRKTLPADPLPSTADASAIEKNDLVRIARMLGEIQETDFVRPFMLRMSDLARTPGQRVLVANLATALGRADIAVAVARRSEQEGVPLITAGYPIPSLALSDQPERALVLGLIRQESAFHLQAVSTAGARGLMQLMPATAMRVAKTLNVAFPKQKNIEQALTSDPGLNVRLGSAFLSNLLTDFDGSYLLAVASYNAGPNRVKKWVHDLGDPRSSQIDVVDWIESIPYPETRNYTQRVLEGAQIYRQRLGGPGNSLEADLHRVRNSQ